MNGSLLSSLPLFAGLSPEDLARVEALAHTWEVEAGHVICRRGDPGTDLYVVVSGAVDVMQGDVHLVTSTPGHVLGELSILAAAPRSADLVARERSTLLVIPGGRFINLIDQRPSMVRSLLAVLVARFKETASRQVRVEQLVRAYRERGHVRAKLDPLGRPHASDAPELDLAYHGLVERDLDAIYTVLIGPGHVRKSLREMLDDLRRTYCGAVGVQYMHIDDLRVQEWLRDRLENPIHHRPFSSTDQLHILRKLTDAEVFETTVHRKVPRNKRFSLEGSETLIPLLDQAIRRAAEHGIDEVVMGMSHRGRLNVLANLLGMSPRELFERLDAVESQEPEHEGGDVPFHLGFETDVGGVKLALCFNPSHLECVAPVVVGRARARQDARGDRSKVLPLVVHGDAAFAGQGIVQELLNMSELPGYAAFGTVHVVLNNQIGFTTLPEHGRSTQYATDVARMLQIPVLHVNGERPEAVDAVIRLAMDFRATWGRDVVVDMYSLRRHGHTEEDDPSFTQPLIARQIASRPPLREVYARNLVALGQVTAEQTAAVMAASRAALEAGLSTQAPPSRQVIRLGTSRRAPIGDLQALRESLSKLPDGFVAHRKIMSMLGRRAKGDVDWATGELLAYATLLRAGIPVRLTGQDSERGTFAHRHAVVYDQRTGAPHAVLPGLDIHNSPLSEAGVLAFEFGYSLESPGLVIWEAQFGDFANGAQVIIDQFLVSSEEKWQQHSGLVAFLPHGLEGKGPEHSSARPERFLQLAVNGNIDVCHLSTAAQVFHRLRAQAINEPHRPLIALTPKRLLQHRLSCSPLSELEYGQFRPVIVETEGERLIIAIGQVYADLVQERRRRGVNVALARLEQLHPFPEAELRELIDRFGGATVVQEEPENMGAMAYLEPRLRRIAGDRVRILARPAAAAPATGWKLVHERQRRALLDRAFEQEPLALPMGRP